MCQDQDRGCFRGRPPAAVYNFTSSWLCFSSVKTDGLIGRIDECRSPHGLSSSFRQPDDLHSGGCESMKSLRHARKGNQHRPQLRVHEQSIPHLCLCKCLCHRRLAARMHVSEERFAIWSLLCGGWRIAFLLKNALHCEGGTI